MKGSVGRHIVFIVENASVPHDLRVWKEARLAKSLGYEVTIVSPRGPLVDREKYVELDGITIYRYGQIVLGSGFSSYIVEYLNALFFTAWLLRKIDRKKRIDAFHVANPPDLFFLVLQLYRLRGCQYIFDIHDLFVNTFESKFEKKRSFLKKPIVHFLKSVERTNIACTDLVVVTNQSYREFIQTHYQVPSEKIFVVRNAPPLDQRSAVPPDQKLLNGRKYMMVFFGNMGEDDGVDVVLKAASHLITVRQFNDFVIYLIGPTEKSASPAIAELRRLHAQLGLQDHVIFTGYLTWEDVHKYLNTAHVGLSPDLFTPQNNLSTMIKMMEYMSHGLPIVSFDLKENRYSGGDAAVYCSSFDYREFGDEVLTLLNDPAQRERMGEIGFERYRNTFNWEESIKHLSATYQRLDGLFRTHSDSQ